jgi:plasmid stabilization system protein ParE
VNKYTVEFTPESEDQLAELYRYIATQASPEVAYQYTEAVIAFCEGLSQFPERGTPRDDIRPALRVSNPIAKDGKAGSSTHFVLNRVIRFKPERG